ncbi:MAG: type II secretion system major pseudopilin GspG [Candidatus Manganitrophaceae bacterium]
MKREKRDQKETATGRNLQGDRGGHRNEIDRGLLASLARSEKGFTLIEIMVVITILAILSVLVVPKLVGRTDEARRVAAKVQIKNIEQALQMYKLDSGVYPSTEQGLDALVRKPSVGQAPKNWREGGYLPKVPPDPWGNPFIYASPGSHGDYDLVSHGSDGEGGGEGKDADIESWNME